MKNLFVFLIAILSIQAADFPKRERSQEQLRIIKSHQSSRSPSPQPVSPRNVIRQTSQEKIRQLQQQRAAQGGH